MQKKFFFFFFKKYTKIALPLVLICSDLGLYGGFVVVNGGGETARVPFFGLKGDYSKLNPVDSIILGTVRLGEWHLPNMSGFNPQSNSVP